MKKITFLLILFLFSSIAFPEDQIGFLGIPFGTSESEANKVMISKGWKSTNRLAFDDTVIIYYEGKTYAGKDVVYVDISFDKNRLFQGSVLFTDNIEVNKIVDAFIKKYNLKELIQNSYSNFELGLYFDHFDEHIIFSCSKYMTLKELDMTEVEKDI